MGDLASAVSWRHVQIVGRQRIEPHRVGARRSAHRVPAHSDQSRAFVATVRGRRRWRTGTRAGQPRRFQTVDLTDRSLETELPSRLVTRRPAHCARCRGLDGRTDRVRGQRHRIDARRRSARRVGGRTQLARCAVARAQPSSPARCPEPVDSAARIPLVRYRGSPTIRMTTLE